MECKVTQSIGTHQKVLRRKLKPEASNIVATFATSGPSLVIGTIFTPPFGKERESRPKLVCDGRSSDGLTRRGALGISTADRVIEIPDNRQSLGQSGNDTACLPKGA